MDEIDLALPASVVESLPEGGEDAAADMERAVAGYEDAINRAIEEAEDDGAVAGALVDAIERMEDRAETYDGFVPELRAWGQSPIYAVAWRNLHVSLVRQLYDREDVAARVDRERNLRIVEDGIRHRDR